MYSCFLQQQPGHTTTCDKLEQIFDVFCNEFSLFEVGQAQLRYRAAQFNNVMVVKTHCPLGQVEACPVHKPKEGEVHVVVTTRFGAHPRIKLHVHEIGNTICKGNMHARYVCRIHCRHIDAGQGSVVVVFTAKAMTSSHVSRQPA